MHGPSHPLHGPSHPPPGPWTRKPLAPLLVEFLPQQNRHLNLWDLISIGVGGTVGSGIFVLLGAIAHKFAGPSTCLSFAISGGAAGVSGCAFAEWSSHLPGGAAGSTYQYAYVALGEWPAVVAAACLTLEYGVSGAAVARSWGDKVLECWWKYVQHQYHHDDDDDDDDTTGTTTLNSHNWNPLAGLLCLLAVLLLTCGVQEAKRVTNVFTVLKVTLVLFLILGGMYLSMWEPDSNPHPFRPFFPFGVAGTLRGATSSFFAYLGYDEVCCFAAEAKHPSKDIPRAVLSTIAIVTCLYVLASLALIGMVEDASNISETSAFPAAFASRGVQWAAQVAAAGEIITLPVVRTKMFWRFE